MIATTTEPRWAPRPVLAMGVRVLQYGLPLLAGTFVTWVLAPVTARLLPSLAAWAASMALAVTVSLLVSRATMRLAPLALLLRMTMIFPDHAPSRLKVARRSTGADEIRRRLVSDRADEQEAAVTMLALVTALGGHDRHTRGHSERVRLFCDLLSRELGLSEADAGRLRWAALIHDVGKLEVSAAVLNKAGRLDRDEWSQVRLHPEAGARLAQPLREWLGPWFAGIAEHHERYDGTGYPRGLAAEQISLAGRAVAVVDAFETMTAARSYKAAVTAVAARAELTRCAGTHFDPTVVRAFLGIALPRLLWSVGPLAFAINVPFLRWIGDGGLRIAQAASSTATGAVNAAGVTAGVTAVVVAGSAVPSIAGTDAPATATRVLAQARPGTSSAGAPGTTAPAAGSGARAAQTAGSVLVAAPSAGTPSETASATAAARSSRAQTAPRPQTADDEAGRGLQPTADQPEKVDQPEKAEKPKQAEKPEKVDQPEKADKPHKRKDSTGKKAKAPKKGERPKKGEKPTPTAKPADDGKDGGKDDGKGGGNSGGSGGKGKGSVAG